jgi:multiple sugar transport system substrate-binding protein
MTWGGFALVGVLTLAGCTGGAADDADTGPISEEDIQAALEEPTELTLWAWLPDVEDEVALFEAKYPAIDVTVENVGQGPDHYAKVRAAIEAGQGAPDAIQVEYPYISGFQLTDDLLDLTPYVPEDFGDGFVEWVWNQVSKDGQILAVPQDSGPMGNLYRSDIMAEAGITEAPGTWAEYAEAAETVKAATGSYITDLPPNDAGAFIGLLWAAGVKPFAYDGGESVGIELDTPQSQEVVTYWQDLIDRDLVAVDPNFTDQWYQGLSSGKYAGWLTAAWGPVFLQGTVADTAGLWTAARLPQWNEGDDVSGNVGGSSTAVLKSTENPIAAAELAKFINTDLESITQFNTQQSLFPPQVELLESDEFLAQKSDFFAGQDVNALFADISTTVDATFEWPPFMDYVYSSFEETLGSEIANGGDLSAGLTAWQSSLEEYATQQGFELE